MRLQRGCRIESPDRVGIAHEKGRLDQLEIGARRQRHDAGLPDELCRLRQSRPRLIEKAFASRVLRGDLVERLLDRLRRRYDLELRADRLQIGFRGGEQFLARNAGLQLERAFAFIRVSAESPVARALRELPLQEAIERLQGGDRGCRSLRVALSLRRRDLRAKQMVDQVDIAGVFGARDAD